MPGLQSLKKSDIVHEEGVEQLKQSTFAGIHDLRYFHKLVVYFDWHLTS